jgi:hypothetical protein
VWALVSLLSADWRFQSGEGRPCSPRAPTVGARPGQDGLVGQACPAMVRRRPYGDGFAGQACPAMVRRRPQVVGDGFAVQACPAMVRRHPQVVGDDFVGQACPRFGGRPYGDVLTVLSDLGWSSNGKMRVVLQNTRKVFSCVLGKVVCKEPHHG